MAQKKLEGKVAVIADVCTPLGAATAKRFAAEGAKVAFFGPCEECGKETLEAIQAAGGEAMFCKVDITDEAAVTAFFDEVRAKYGKVTTSVCMHTVENTKSFEELDDEDWNEYMERDGLGAIYVFNESIKDMSEQRAGSFLKIVGPYGGKQPDVRCAFDAYFSAGWKMMIECASMEWAPWGVRSNTLEVGIVDDGTKEWTQEEIYYAQSPDGLRRPATLDEITNTILFISSDDASYITGHNFVANGGNVARSFTRETWEVGTTEFKRAFEGGGFQTGIDWGK